MTTPSTTIQGEGCHDQRHDSSPDCTYEEKGLQVEAVKEPQSLQEKEAIRGQQQQEQSIDDYKNVAGALRTTALVEMVPDERSVPISQQLISVVEEDTCEHETIVAVNDGNNLNVKQDDDGMMRISRSDDITKHVLASNTAVDDEQLLKADAAAANTDGSTHHLSLGSVASCAGSDVNDDHDDGNDHRSSNYHPASTTTKPVQHHLTDHQHGLKQDIKVSSLPCVSEEQRLIRHNTNDGKDCNVKQTVAGSDQYTCVQKQHTMLHSPCSSSSSTLRSVEMSQHELPSMATVTAEPDLNSLRVVKSVHDVNHSMTPKISNSLQVREQEGAFSKSSSIHSGVIPHWMNAQNNPMDSNKGAVGTDGVPWMDGSGSFQIDDVSASNIPPSLSESFKHVSHGTTASSNEMAYRDFSRLTTDDTSTDPPGKEPPFPVKLHRILSNQEFSDVICWLPHGRSWRVLKPKAFEEKVIPLYFRHAKYASFMRQVNGWGFKRITQGPDHNSYYHELFLRGIHHLCFKMRRPTKARVEGDPDYNPDFYRLSMVAPLPDKEANHFTIGDSSGIIANPSFHFNTVPGFLSGGTNNFHGDRGTLSSTSAFPIMNNAASMNISMNRNMSAGLNLFENSLNPNSVQQLIQHVNSRGHGQISATSFNSFENWGNNLVVGASDINMEQIQLEALRQRREELIRQLQQMIGNSNPGSMGPGMQALNQNVNSLMLRGTNGDSNATILQNVGNVTQLRSLLGQGFDSNPSSELQQMRSLGLVPNSYQNPTLHSLGRYEESLRSSSAGTNITNIPYGTILRDGMNSDFPTYNRQLLMQNSYGGTVGNGTHQILGIRGLSHHEISHNFSDAAAHGNNRLNTQPAGNNSSTSTSGNLFDGKRGASGHA